MTRARSGLDLMLAPVVFFALVGLGLSCTLVTLQVVNPVRQILSLEHYQSYYMFFAMGDRLPEFGCLGVLAAGLMMLCFLAWALGKLQLASWWRRAWTEGVPLASLPMAGMRVLFLYGVATAGALGLLVLDAAMGPSFHPWHAEVLRFAILGLPSLAAAVFGLGALLHRGAVVTDVRSLLESWRGGGWSAWGTVSAALLLGTSLSWLVGEWLVWWVALSPYSPLRFLSQDDFWTPPFLLTHFGPWGIVACVTGTMTLVGLAVGIAIYGLAPGDGEDAVPAGRASVAALVAITCVATVLAFHYFYLVPRYQIGQDLRHLLGLRQGTVEGRTVVWLDEPRASDRVAALTCWSTTENMERVGQWILHAPWPSAQTRPAAVTLGNRALWDWDPDQALRWLDVQRGRQPHDSNLNAAMAEILRSTMPTPRRVDWARAFTDGSRFAWPGGISHMRVAALLHRIGDEAEARSWWARGEELLGSTDEPAVRDLARTLAAPPPVGEIRGRLMRDGRALAGVRVALYHTFDETPNIVGAARQAVEREPGLVDTDTEWNPSRQDYMNFRNLRALYAVVETDAAGAFRFAPLDRGRYLLAVRLPGASPSDIRVENGAGLPLLVPGRMHVDVGVLHLREY